VLVHFNKDWVKVLDAQTHALLIVHKTLEGKGKLSVQQSCKPPYANRPKEQQEMYYCRKAAVIGKNCERLVEHFLVPMVRMAFLALSIPFAALLFTRAVFQIFRQSFFCYVG
jgi:hypothetical protein